MVDLKKMGRNDEAFCLLAEEFARTRTLLDKINFTRLMRLTVDLESQISGNTDRNKNNEPLLLQTPQSNSAIGPMFVRS